MSRKKIVPFVDKKVAPVKAEYDAVIASPSRKKPKNAVRHESIELPPSKRAKLNSTIQDAQRNLQLLAYMVDLHISYVCTFNARVRTGYEKLDKYLMKKLAQHARPDKFDAGGRHSRFDSLQLFERLKVVEGDAAWILLDNGSITGCEGSRICLPSNVKDYPELEGFASEGIKLDEYGKAIEYSIVKMNPENANTQILDQIVSADSIIYDGHFKRYSQIRGISPLSAALNTLIDVDSICESTLMKVRLHAIFGLAFYRDQSAPTNDFNTDSDSEDEERPNYNVELQSNRIAILDLAPGDKAMPIESNTPSTSVIEFSQLMIRVALLALGIPYSFFDSRGVNLSTRTADRIQYEEAIYSKKLKNQEILRKYADWMVPFWLQNDRELQKLVIESGYENVSELASEIEWIPGGIPWYSKASDCAGDAAAIALGLDTYERCASRRGFDFYQNLEDNKRAQEKALELGINLASGMPGQSFLTENGPSTNPDNGKYEDDDSELIG